MIEIKPQARDFDGQPLKVEKTDTFDHFIGKVGRGENDQWGLLQKSEIIYVRRGGVRIGTLTPVERKTLEPTA